MRSSIPPAPKRSRVASCKLPLGRCPSLSWLIVFLRLSVHAMWVEGTLLDYFCAPIFFDAPKKAAAIAFVANARPDGLDSMRAHPHRGSRRISRTLNMAARLTFFPSAIPRPAEKDHFARTSRLRQRLFVQKTQHQDIPGVIVLDDRGTRPPTLAKAISTSCLLPGVSKLVAKNKRPAGLFCATADECFV